MRAQQRSKKRRKRKDGDDDKNHEERAHEEATKIKNVQRIQFGKYMIDTWYYSPFPQVCVHACACVCVCVCVYVRAYAVSSQLLSPPHA